MIMSDWRVNLLHEKKKKKSHDKENNQPLAGSRRVRSTCNPTWARSWAQDLEGVHLQGNYFSRLYLRHATPPPALARRGHVALQVKA